jgi:hypothetical protein
MKKLTPAQRTFLETLANAKDGVDDQHGAPRLRARLIAQGYIAQDAGLITITEAGREAAGLAPPSLLVHDAAAKATKTASLQALLIRPQGATLEEMCTASGWQPHSVRGFISGSLKKKMGLTVLSAQQDGVRTYRIERGAQGAGA